MIFQIVRSAISNYIGTLLSLATWAVLTPFTLRYVGAAHYGLWVLAGAIVAYGSLLDFGIGSTVTKHKAEYRARGENEQVQSLIATALVLYLVIGLMIFAVTALVAPLFPSLFHI